MMRRITVAAVIWLAFVSLPGVVARPAYAADPVVSIGDGPVIIPSGGTAALPVRIADAKDLYGFELRVRFDPAVVEVVDADPLRAGVQVGHGNFLALDFLVRNRADNETGTVEYVLSQLSPSAPKSGDGVLLTLYLKGKAAGRSTEVSAEKLQLAGPGGVALSASVIPGLVRVAAAETPIASPTPLPTQAAAGTGHGHANSDPSALAHSDSN